MTTNVPLGQQEGPHLEFKGRAALDEPDGIVREIIGMLNAEGGEVWVGITDRGGRAVDVETVDDAEQHVRRLWNVFVDTIEPAPQHGELQLEVVADEGARVLRIVVTPNPARGPYAQLRRGGSRYFGIRIGERNRNMQRDELARRFRDESAPQDKQQAATRLTEMRHQLQREGASCLWLALKPTETMTVRCADPKLKGLFRDATLTNNRANGWNFINPYQEAELKSDRVTLQIERQGLREVAVYDDGTITLRLDLADLHWKGDEHELWPFALIEYTVSVFRLAGIVYDSYLESAVATSRQVLGDVALLGLRGWRLRPYSPSSAGFLFGDAATPFDDPDLTWEQPLRFTVARLRTEPDACGYDAVRRIYRGFGFAEDKIPKEFRDGRLTMP